MGNATHFVRSRLQLFSSHFGLLDTRHLHLGPSNFDVNCTGDWLIIFLSLSIFIYIFIYIYLSIYLSIPIITRYLKVFEPSYRLDINESMVNLCKYMT
jgi:hypothetical protein